tara:strand:- start:789 stop:917 length:129 start_codon:yes stop_codon:yes gene_type:complete
MAKPIEGVRINDGANWWKHLRKYAKRNFNKRLRKAGKKEAKA